MANHTNILAWEIRRTEEPIGLQSMGSQELAMTERLNSNNHSLCIILCTNYLVALSHTLRIRYHEHTHFADEETEAQLGEELACPVAWAHRVDNSLNDKLDMSQSDLIETRPLAKPSTVQ